MRRGFETANKVAFLCCLWSFIPQDPRALCRCKHRAALPAERGKQCWGGLWLHHCKSPWVVMGSHFALPSHGCSTAESNRQRNYCPERDALYTSRTPLVQMAHFSIVSYLQSTNTGLKRQSYFQLSQKHAQKGHWCLRLWSTDWSWWLCPRL